MYLFEHCKTENKIEKTKVNPDSNKVTNPVYNSDNSLSSDEVFINDDNRLCVNTTYEELNIKMEKVRTN